MDAEGTLSHSVVKGHDWRIRAMRVHEGNLKPLYAEEWVSCVCVNYGRGKMS